MTCDFLCLGNLPTRRRRWRSRVSFRRTSSCSQIRSTRQPARRRTRFTSWSGLLCFGKFDARSNFVSEAHGFSARFAVGDVFQHAVFTDAIQREVWIIEILIKRLIVPCVRRNIFAINVIAHGLKLSPAPYARLWIIGYKLKVRWRGKGKRCEAGGRPRLFVLQRPFRASVFGPFLGKRLVARLAKGSQPQTRDAETTIRNSRNQETRS